MKLLHRSHGVCFCFFGGVGWGILSCGFSNPFGLEEAGNLSIMAEFILETNYPSRRIICQTDNLSKYKSEDEF